MAALLGAWMVWFALAEVALYETTDAARLEVDHAVHPVEALRIAISRQSADQRARDSSQQATLESLQRDAAALEGEIKTRATTVERLQHEINQRFIRAPATGKLGEVADLRAGQVVREGDKLGAVIPDGRLRVVAEFPPSDSLGKIRAGQPAQLRLEGFPWTEYGKVPCEVTSVASEPRSGRVRVELLARPESAPLIPLQHGLPGKVEIEVERVSPAALVLRSVGKMLTDSREKLTVSTQRVKGSKGQRVKGLKS